MRRLRPPGCQTALTFRTRKYMNIPVETHYGIPMRSRPRTRSLVTPWDRRTLPVPSRVSSSTHRVEFRVELHVPSSLTSLCFHRQTSIEHWTLGMIGSMRQCCSPGNFDMTHQKLMSVNASNLSWSGATCIFEVAYSRWVFIRPKTIII